MVSLGKIASYSAAAIFTGSLGYQFLYKPLVPPEYWPLSFDVRLVMLKDEDGTHLGVDAEKHAGRLSSHSPVIAYDFYDPWTGKHEKADFSDIQNSIWTWKDTKTAASFLEFSSASLWRRIPARYDFMMRNAYYQARVKKLDIE